MIKFEKKFFNLLVEKYGFYIRSFKSPNYNKEYWIAVLENESVQYAVIVVENNYDSTLYSEALDYLKTICNKTAIINEIVISNDNYGYNDNTKNMLIFSSNEKKVVYSSESCKLLIPIINQVYENNKKRKKKSEFTLLTNILIITNVLVFLISAMISKNIFDIDSYTLIIMGAKVNVLINQGQIWRLLTCAFLHGGLIHLFFNMYALKILGPQIEFVYGRIRYMTIYLLSALSASIFSYIFGPNSISVGASGAIFGMFGAMLIFGIKHRKQIGKAYMMNIIQVIVVNVIIGLSSSNIDNAAHLGGLISGMIVALIIGEVKKINGN